MTRGPRAAIRQVGVRSAAGRTGRLALLGLRAGLVGTTDLRLPLSTVRVAVDPDEPPTVSFAERVETMATKALAEACIGLPREPMPLFLVTSPRVTEKVPDLVDRLERGAGAAFDRRRVRVLPGSPTLFAAALARALELLKDPSGPPRVLCGAVDSWIDEATIEDLLRQELVATVATQELPDGAFVPGEAAAFVVLERENAPMPLAWVSPPSASGDGQTSVEPETMALSLAQAIESHGDALWLFTEQNGQAWRNRRWSKAVMLARKARPTIEIEETALATEIGDVGAAALAVSVAAAALELSSRAGPLDHALVGAVEDTMFATVMLEAGPERVVALPPPPSPSRLARGVARLSAAVLGIAGELRPVRHRIAPRVRGPIERSLSELHHALSTLEEAEVGEGSIAALDLAKRAAGDVAAHARAAEAADRAKKRDPEPALASVVQVAAAIEGRLGLLRTPLVDEAARRLEGPRAAGLEAPGPFCSRGTPALYPLEVTRVPSPSLDDVDAELDDADPEESFVDEDEPAVDAEAKESEAPPPSRSIGVASECLDTVGRMGLFRTPPPFSRWSTAFGNVDQTIVAHLDLFHGLAAPLPLRAAPPLLSDVAVDVSELLSGRPSAFEPARAFATTLVLGSAHDPRLQRAAVRNAVGAHPELFEPLSDALALASGQQIGPLVAELCLVEDEVASRIALEVMARRRTVSVGGATMRIYDADPAVRLAAARALGVAREREAAIRVLATRLEMEPSAAVAVAIVEALVRQREPEAELRVSRALEDLVVLGPLVPLELAEARRGYARLAAALGLSREAALFATVAKTPSDVEVLGWFGRVVVVSALIGLLPSEDADDPTMAKAAARALIRIFGVRLDVDQKPARLVPKDWATVPEDELVMDGRLWAQYWDAVGGDLSTSVKYRFGRRMDVGLAAREHVADGVRVVDREMTSLELAAFGVAAADERDWVSRQLASVASVSSR